MFNKHPISSEPYISPLVRAADVTDGLSNTVAMSEFLHANWSGGSTMERMRTVWSLPEKYNTAAELDSMANECARVPPDPIAYGWNGSAMKLGFTWWDGNCEVGMYNHVLEPNRPSCRNGNGAPHLGVTTAASLHSGGVNVVYGDGHVSFVSNSIDREVWREMGSRIRQNLGTMP
jgi:prepilin-type processing-associated H-X9-DG protein